MHGGNERTGDQMAFPIRKYHPRKRRRASFTFVRGRKSQFAAISAEDLVFSCEDRLMANVNGFRVLL